MSPQPNTVSDRESQNDRGRLGRPPASRTEILAAAGAVFDGADPGQAVTMDAVAAAAGVGKGTVFRAFGDRDGLLDALSAARFEPLRTAATNRAELFAPDKPASHRVVGFLDAVLTFKVDNVNLMRARESAGGTDLQSERYRWMHAFLQQLLVEAAPGSTVEASSYVAHALLAALRIDLLDQLFASGQSVEEIRRCQTEHALAVVDRLGRNWPESGSD